MYLVIVHVIVLLLGRQLLHDHVSLVHIRRGLLLLLLQACQGLRGVCVVDRRLLEV